MLSCVVIFMIHCVTHTYIGTGTHSGLWFFLEVSLGSLGLLVHVEVYGNLLGAAKRSSCDDFLYYSSHFVFSDSAFFYSCS
jgi:hypothetical protein